MTSEFNSTRENLSDALVHIRKNANLSRTELAGLLDKDKAFVQAMESPSTPFPSPSEVSDYVNACQCGFGIVFVQQTPDTESDSRVVVVPMNKDKESDKRFRGAIKKRNIQEYL